MNNIVQEMRNIEFSIRHVLQYEEPFRKKYYTNKLPIPDDALTRLYALKGSIIRMTDQTVSPVINSLNIKRAMLNE